MVQESDDDRRTGEEAAVLDDIRYFETCIASLEHSDRRDLATVQVYRLLLRQRRQLLAAIRDGVPERWPEYALAPDPSHHD